MNSPDPKQTPVSTEVHEPTLRTLIVRGDLGTAQEWERGHPPWEVADSLDRMEPKAAATAFRLLESEHALEVFEELKPSTQEAVLDVMRDQEFRDFVDALAPDDRARMLGELPSAVAQRVLAGLSPAEREMTATLLGYPEGSAGRYMTPQVVVLAESLSVASALEHVRAVGKDVETIYTLPVVDVDGHLTGVVSLRELVLAADDVPVSEFVVTDPPHVHATEPAERAARLMVDANLLDLPVVDPAERVIGLLTYDDADEVIERAETEDAARQGGSNAWAGHYMAVSVLKMARSRFVWVVPLLGVSLLTVTVAYGFEEALEEEAALAIFIPLLIGTGGKVGTQASSACVRALAIGEVRPSDALRVTARECATGVLLGVGLGLLAIGAGVIFADLSVAFVVGLSLLLICVLGALVGGLSPLVAKRFGVDPALVSAPVVTTVVDVLGLIIYFVVASIVLGV